MADIFISYRRENGHLMARLFYHRLIADGYKVFMDVEDLGPGTFDERLYHEIEQCTDFILILPPNALDRCQNPKDWVRMEIEHALNYDKNIIPILMQGFEYPNNLPESIQRVAKYNGLEAPPPRYYDALYSKLKEEFLISKPQEEEEYTLAEEPTPFYPTIDEVNSKNAPAKHESQLTAPQEKRTDAPKEMQDTPDEYRDAFGDEPEVKKKPSKNYVPEKDEKPGKPTPRHFIPTLAAILIFAAIVWSIVWFAGAPQREIDKEATELMAQAQQMLDDGEYQSAIQILDRISTEWKKYSQVETAHEQANRGILLNQVRQYETAGKYEQLIRFVQENIQDPETDPDVRNLYANAATEYEALKLSEAEAMIQQGDYITARSTLDAAASLIGQQPNLTDKRNEAEDKEVAAKVQAYEDAENYEEAIKYLNKYAEVVGRNSSLQAIKEEYEKIYRNQVLATAETSYKTAGPMGYKTATSIIDKGLEVLKEDHILLAEKTKYEKLAPIRLVDLSTFYSDYGSDTKSVNATLKSNLGTEYSNCIIYYGGYSLFTDWSINTFNKRDIYVINKEYSRFEATIFVPESRTAFWDNEIPDSYKEKGAFTLRIFGDGKQIYQSPLMISTQYPVHVDIDITGIDQLAFAWSTFSDVSAEIAITDAYLYKE